MTTKKLQVQLQKADPYGMTSKKDKSNSKYNE